jgi:hypothetical protein
MTINSVVTPVSSDGDGSNKNFSVPFKVFTASELKVTKFDTTTNTSTVLATPADYTVTSGDLALGTATITLTGAAPVATDKIIREHIPQFLQEANYVQNDDFPAETHERGLDLLTQQSQYLKNIVEDRLFGFSSNVTDAGTLAITADSASRANKAIKFDASGDLAISTNNVDTILDDANTAKTAAESAQTAAESAQTAAEAAQTASETALDTFDDIFLGSKASDPTVDNDGDALQEGAIYWNSTSNSIRFYNGSAWVDGFSSAALFPANNLSDVADAATARTNLGLGNGATYDIANQAEAEAGTATNKNMTPQRVAQAIAALADGGIVKSINFSESKPSVSTTSTTYVDCTGTVTLTPASTSSKFIILVTAEIMVEWTSGSFLADVRITRNGSSIEETIRTGAQQKDVGQLSHLMSIACQDAPSTTSSVSYKAQVRVGNGAGTIEMAGSNGHRFIVVVEYE